MRFDMHYHVIGGGTDIDRVDEDVYYHPEDNHHWFVRILYSLVENELEEMGAQIGEDGRLPTAEYLRLTYELLATSNEIDAVVLLGMDGVFSPKKGRLNEKKTDLWVSTRFLAKAVAELNARLAKDRRQGVKKKRFYFAPSVSPNRPDWEEELAVAIAEPFAVALKIIPSVLHVRLGSKKHRDYYRALADAGLPLLCHVGPEYAFPEGMRRRELDDFRKLERALDCGVTVIGAHCATPVFPLVDKDEVKEFHAFMRDANSGGEVRLWGDTSALSITTRMPVVPKVLDLFPPEWLVNGSDFPIPVEGGAHLPYVAHDVTPAEYLEIRRTKNALDREVRIKRAMGFDDSILTNAEKVLRLPA